MIELKNSKTTYLGKASGGDKYALDAFIGAVQMREPEGQWQDIKPCLARDADGWHIEGAPYYAEIKDDGSRLFCPDRNERRQYLRLPGVSLFSGLSRDVVSNPNKLDTLLLPNQINMPTTWGEIRIIFSNTGMHFEILFREAPPPDLFGRDSPRILLDAETTGFDIESLLKATSGTGIPKPRLIAVNLEALTSESQEKWLDWSYKNGQLELGFDFGDLPFPILLKNTTIDVQVGIGADDARERESSGAVNIDDAAKILNDANTDAASRYWGGYRWDLGTTIAQSSTVDVCYMQLYVYDANYDDANFNVHFQKAAAPVAFTINYYDMTGRTRTTASLSWVQDSLGTGWKQSASLVSVLQEVVDAYSVTAVAAITRPNQDAAKSVKARSQEYGSSLSAKLHIEYTVGGATAKNSSDSGAGVDSRLSFLASLSRADTGGSSDGATGRGLVIDDTGYGADALTALMAAILAAETGGGLEHSTLSSIVLKLSVETGSGVDIAGLVAGLASNDTGLGADAGMILGLKSIFGGDGGTGYDALKALIGTSGVGSDMRLPGRPGQIRIPSKGVSL